MALISSVASTAPTPTGSAQWPALRPRWRLSSPARGSVPAIGPTLVVKAPLPPSPAAPDPGEGVSAPAPHLSSSLPSPQPPSGGPLARDTRLALDTPVSHISQARGSGWPLPVRVLPKVAGTSRCPGFGRRGPLPQVPSPATDPTLVLSGSPPAPSSGSRFRVTTSRSPASRWGLLPTAVDLGLGLPLANGPPCL